MNRLLLLAALAVLPISRPAVAAPVAAAGGELDTVRGAARKAEGEIAPLHLRRAALATQAATLAAEIDARKREAPGVRRDLDLQRLLAASKAKTDELERVQLELRWRETGLVELHRKLVRTIDEALERDAAHKSMSDAARVELEHLRASTVAQLVSGTAPLQIAHEPTAAEADPLDGPRELRYKADLLRDSVDKLRREATRIATRIDSVERRRHLRERAGALDDDMFGEATSSRHVARTQGALATGDRSNKAGNTTTVATPTQSPSKGTTPNDPAVGGTPTAPALGAGMTAGPPPGTTTTPAPAFDAAGAVSPAGSTARAAESTVLSNLVDPATLDELRHADSLDDADRQTRALRRAQGELEALAKELDRRAKALEGRAAALRNQK